VLAAALLSVCGAGLAQQPGDATLFHDVRIYDGHGSSLSGPSHVLVRGGRIERISATAIAPPPSATVIDAQGRTLMPGLIDNHWHTMLAAPPLAVTLEGDLGYLTLLAAALSISMFDGSSSPISGCLSLPSLSSR